MKMISLSLLCLLTIFSNLASATKLPYQSLQRPITAKKLFKECESSTLFSNKYSELCDMWDSHIKLLEKKLIEKCSDAGENIYRTVRNVKGVIIKYPNNNQSKHFHKQEKLQGMYILPSMGRNYRIKEELLTNGKIRQYSISNIRKGIYGAKFDSNYDNIDKSTQRYEISYKPLTSNQDIRLGLHGDHTTIKDTESGDVLAERKFYYYVVNNRIRLENGQMLRMPSRHHDFRYIATCKNFSPQDTSALTHLYPFNSYEFVSRYLFPKGLQKMKKNISTRSQKAVAIKVKSVLVYKVLAQISNRQN